ncbi:hypothetical protein E6P09_01470 [Haloferax mediterranei ATCC 33500]|uniref:Halobacterial output domain-containing protein n=1 Tax=Haloferax mediterranei (strain ATCC 33500 / DSM 1411 / JCM 8866 / NBRC 14739 / NCIMB 2177 / R-4) TaxID=523841 RepID=I3R678_HALMT|nr:HalOD1 output domain-containing protein [Haloferax mediterranei]AFK19738.1 hypothetical protein HFX_2046 [Haloferax mediterranei ATCC 33500]AHZ23124.1 hypothetical protein BM92_10970 [Haloferax mediterranei ATCC 33500]EMA00059.1 hypothetical protein C439_12003 [Haloferax mediterranei ATCC 33500]MDX5987518.1 HalOD1 output domain-containing protein [Haloferax mediterranei ATCC 33500]QCQ74016.1 hypothetical protein E6P09_01470 [Haloferax mediterranei ATCC 33500]
MDETRVLQGNDVGWNTGTSEEVVARHDWDGQDTLAVTVVSATAQLIDKDVSELPPLSETIDPDALSRLFAPLSREPASGEPIVRGSKGSARGRVRFRYAACDVTVWADGTVMVTST